MLAQDLFLNFKGESLQSSRAAWIKFKKSTLGFKRIFFSSESVVQNLYISIYTPRFLSLFFLTTRQVFSVRTETQGQTAKWVRKQTHEKKSTIEEIANTALQTKTGGHSLPNSRRKAGLYFLSAENPIRGPLLFTDSIAIRRNRLHRDNARQIRTPSNVMQERFSSLSS